MRKQLCHGRFLGTMAPTASSRAISRFACFFAAAACILLAAAPAPANVLNLPSGQTSLGFVTVGNPGNTADPLTELGAVGYTYQIGTYNVTAAQYVAFLNAVAATDTYGLYNSTMSDPAACNIQQNGSSGSYTYSVAPQDANLPVNYITWGDAARFCNWLTNGQPTGSECLATTENGSYYLNGANTDTQLALVARTANARYVLPSQNQWYKAAYYNGATGNYWLYPTQSNSAPVAEAPPGSGGASGSANYGSVMPLSDYLTSVGAYANSPGPYGTFDQGGLLFQWTDTLLTAYYGSGFAMECSSFESAPSELESTNEIWPWSPESSDYNFCGFRVAEVPEPSTLCLLVAGVGAILALLWRRRQG